MLLRLTAVKEKFRFGAQLFLYQFEQVSFDRMVDPADNSRLHQSDRVTGRVACPVKLAIVGGADKARSSVAADIR